jgi:flagellar motor switch protein FliN/FliY
MESSVSESNVVDPVVLEDLAGRNVERHEGAKAGDLSLVDHVQVRMTAVVGDIELSVADLFALKPGTVLELRQLLDEPIILQLNGKAVATAHLVAVDDCFGVQIAEVL